MFDPDCHSSSPAQPAAQPAHSEEIAKTAALHLDALGPEEWAIHFSTYTGRWFVHAKGLYLSDGAMLTGVTVHRDTPEQALLAFVAELRDEGQGRQVVAVEGRGGRRHYRWNGAAFAEVPDFLLPWADNTASLSGSSRMDGETPDA